MPENGRAARSSPRPTAVAPLECRRMRGCGKLRPRAIASCSPPVFSCTTIFHDKRFHDYILDTRCILCYIIFMNHLSTFLDGFSFSALRSWTCFLMCFTTLGWKTWAKSSSLVISLGCLVFFFMEVTYGS